MSVIKDLPLDKFRIFSGSALKLIAIITMFLDHTAILLAPEIPLMTAPLFTFGSQVVTIAYIMRKIGRLAFPIFCFLVAEGFSHTKNQRRYALRLLAFAFISEIPFNVMKSGKFFDLQHQNVFLTLFLGVMMLYVIENVRVNQVIPLFAIGLVAMFCRCDYGLYGVLLIVLMYVLKKRPAIQALLAYPLLSGGIVALMAFIPINMYNGERGFIQSKAMKYAFYVFYPLHIIVLIAVKLILMYR